MPDPRIISFSILIAEKESSFSKKLEEILREETGRHSAHKFNIDVVSNHKSLESYKKTRIDMAFINLSFMEENFPAFENGMGFASETIFVLLISDKGGLNIKKSIELFKSQQHYFFDEHILIDNYSSNILSLFCRELMKRMIDKRVNN